MTPRLWGLPDALLVGVGGFIGSAMRYAVSGLVHRWVPGTAYPVGTLAVNVLGCAAIGLLGGLAESRGVLTAPTRLVFMIGLLGGFTTFSTFGYETLALIRDAQAARALTNVVLQVVLGLTAVWLGLAVSRLI